MLESSIQPQVACRRVSRADGNSGRPPRHNTSQVCHNAASRRSFVPPLASPLCIIHRGKADHYARRVGATVPSGNKPVELVDPLRYEYAGMAGGRWNCHNSEAHDTRARQGCCLRRAMVGRVV
ncbi:hypothetical protein KL938_003117 [Ogataea parapolymorpha]|nr:hypothetical protein KL938_003117 [Ogataea parapolymorpha]